MTLEEYKQLPVFKNPPVHIDNWAEVKWARDKDGNPVAEKPELQEIVEAFDIGKLQMDKLRFFIETLGGEWIT